MRKSYADYGMTGERAKALLGECRKGKYGRQVRSAAYKVCPAAAEHIILSITKNKAYDILEFDRNLGRVPVGRSDFYWHRRHTLAILNHMLMGKEKA